MKKRVISLLLIALMTAMLCLSAVGCDGKNDDGSKDALSTGVKVFVQFVLDHMDGIEDMVTPVKEV